MDEIISAIDTISLRIPLDIWAPAPLSQGVPRTHVESLYVRVTTSNGVVGWGESFGTARPMVIAAFDTWMPRSWANSIKRFSAARFLACCSRVRPTIFTASKPGVSKKYG